MHAGARRSSAALGQKALPVGRGPCAAALGHGPWACSQEGHVRGIARSAGDPHSGAALQALPHRPACSSACHGHTPANVRVLCRRARKAVHRKHANAALLHNVATPLSRLVSRLLGFSAGRLSGWLALLLGSHAVAAAWRPRWCALSVPRWCSHAGVPLVCHAGVPCLAGTLVQPRCCSCLAAFDGVPLVCHAGVPLVCATLVCR